LVEQREITADADEETVLREMRRELNRVDPAS
jgi:hypothetical protein